MVFQKESQYELTDSCLFSADVKVEEVSNFWELRFERRHVAPAITIPMKFLLIHAKLFRGAKLCIFRMHASG